LVQIRKVQTDDHRRYQDPALSAERLDARWREMSLASMRETIEKRRTAWGAVMGRIDDILGRAAGS